VRGVGLSVEARQSWFKDCGMNMESALADLFTFLRFPSVSTDPSRAGSVRECGEWLRNYLEKGGFRATLHETEGHPIVLAFGPVREGRPTVLIYGHYDVQPEVPVSEWDTPPFEPVVRAGRIHARGATDNKGQIFAHACGAVGLLREEGDLPVNLIFLVEGEEEIGSGNLEPFLERHREALRCDVIAVSDTGMVAEGVPTLTCGLRGIAAMEVRLRGPKVDLHSGIYGGAVRNPITALSRLLATLHDAEGRVAVAGFYDGVEDVPEGLRAAWGRLPLNDQVLLEITGAPSLEGEAGYSALERVWARPTAEINGIGGGFQGVGSKTVIPREAFAKLTFRLVPGQNPVRVLELVRGHLERNVERGVELEVELGHTGMPYLVDAEGRYARAAVSALGETFAGREVAVIREGGSIPIITSFKKVLGVDTLLLGLALPDCNAHAPNETFPIANFEAGIRLNGSLLRALARA
jgi:acetylornithine deacetylase/succinyl-diaminopimelate desuccinylase-like protein